MESTEVERSLAAAHERGDRGALVEGLMDAYGGELLGFIAALVRDQDVARDLFADVWESVLTRSDDFEGRSSFRTWVYAIARNAALNHERRRAPFRLSTRRAERLVAVPRPSTRPHLRTTNKDRLARLRAHLDGPSQALLTLRVDRKMSWNDVARVLSDEPLTTDAEVRRASARVRKRFDRIKERLRDAMAAERP